jgi:hypothetical protein
LLEEIERHLAVIQPEVARPMWEIERDAYAAMGQAYEAQTEDQPEQETLDPPSSTDEA